MYALSCKKSEEHALHSTRIQKIQYGCHKRHKFPDSFMHLEGLWNLSKTCFMVLQKRTIYHFFSYAESLQNAQPFSNLTNSVAPQIKMAKPRQISDSPCVGYLLLQFNYGSKCSKINIIYSFVFLPSNVRNKYSLALQFLFTTKFYSYRILYYFTFSLCTLLSAFLFS